MKTTIILQAFTNSEWDSVEFFVTEVNISELEKLDDKIYFLKKDYPDLYHSSFSAAGDFFASDEDGNTPLTEGDFSTVKFDENDFTPIEQRIEYLQMKVYGNGNISFAGFGKHTGEEFWTNSVSIDVIKNRISETEKTTV